MIFIDTGPFIARSVERDQFHSRALRTWEELARTNQRCHTSSYVLDEAFTLLARKTSNHFAAERARALLSSKILHILRPDPKDELDAVELFDKFGDQRVSFTDCISFVLMRRFRLRKAFSFDRHFSLAGFELWPPVHN